MTTFALGVSTALLLFLALAQATYWWQRRGNEPAVAWVVALLTFAAMFTSARVCQMLSWGDPPVLARWVLVSAMFAAWATYHFATAYTGHRTTRTETVITLIAVAVPSVLIGATDLIVTHEVVVRTLWRGETFRGVTLGPGYWLFLVPRFGFGLAGLFFLVRGHTVPPRGRAVIAFAYAAGLVVGLADTITTTLRIPAPRLSDFSSLPLGLVFSLQQLGEFARLYNDMGERVAERTKHLAEANARLSVEERMTRALFDSANVLLVSADADRRVAAANDAALRAVGANVATVLGTPIEESAWFAGDAAIASALAGSGPTEFEATPSAPGGTPRHVSWRVRRVGDSGLVLCEGRDVTDERRWERERERLRHVQKMEAVGNLAGGVAHDFNNLLTVILSYTGLALLEVAPEDPVHAYLEEVQKAGERSAALTRQLLAMSRQQVVQPKVLDLGDVVSGMVRMLQMAVGAHVEVSALRPKTPGRVRADAGQLEQVLLNLAVNARDAMPRGGKLTIETSNVEVLADDPSGVRAGSYVMLSVTDTGAGMDAATQAHIFEPFFTTKAMGKGTGLGLATVLGIVQQSGGHIVVQSKVGQGTLFRIYLPRVDADAEPLANVARTPSKLHGTETILLVEDEEQVRAVTRMVLVQAGYTVLEAQNGGEAFLISEQQKETIHLLLSDMAMPRMTGRQLADRLSMTRPDMKVLFLSGYADSTVVSSEIAYVQKPITPEVLLARVRDALDGSQAHESGLRTAMPAETAPPARGPHVLVVDDDIMIRMIAATLLQAHGCLCDTVEDGKDIQAALARSASAGHPVDLILLDMNLRGQQGDDVLRDLRKAGVDVPVVCMSGGGSPASLPGEGGFDGFIHKPFSAAELESCVDRHARKPM